MADNFITNPAAGGDTFAADDIGGVKWQRVKIGHGADGSATDVSSASPLPVDTELPAAAALSDATANPTAPMVGAAGMVWNGSAWVRRHSAGDSVSLDGVGAVGPELFDGSGTVLQRSVAGDGQAITGIAAAGGMLYNGSTFDRQRGNTEGTLLASAARTAAVGTAKTVNHNARGLVLQLRISAASGTGGLWPVVYGYDVNNVPYLMSTYTPTFRTATGTGLLTVYPGATNPTATDIFQTVSQPIPRSFYVFMFVGDSSSYTYSLTYSLIV